MPYLFAGVGHGAVPSGRVGATFNQLAEDRAPMFDQRSPVFDCNVPVFECNVPMFECNVPVFD